MSCRPIRSGIRVQIPTLNLEFLRLTQIRVSKDGQEKILHGRTEQSSIRAGRQTEAKVVHVASDKADASAT